MYNMLVYIYISATIFCDGSQPLQCNIVGVCISAKARDYKRKGRGQKEVILINLAVPYEAAQFIVFSSIFKEEDGKKVCSSVLYLQIQLKSILHNTEVVCVCVCVCVSVCE